MRARLLTPLFVAVVAVLSIGCSDEGQPGPGPSTGTSSGSLAPDGGSAGSGKKALAVTCAAAEECESNVCFVDAQSFCSLNCTPENAAQVCVSPLTGSCNKKGFCKRN